MPTIISHPAISLAVSPTLQGAKNKPLILFSGALLTVLPDVDVLAFRLGIPYSHAFGHRGFSHSMLFALLASWLLAWINRQKNRKKSMAVWGYLFLCALSHGLLDAMTNGGLGIGLFIPFSMERYFFGFRPIEVSTLSLRRFLDGQGAAVLQNELLWVWVPAIALFVLAFGLVKRHSLISRRLRSTTKTTGSTEPSHRS